MTYRPAMTARADNGGWTTPAGNHRDLTTSVQGSNANDAVSYTSSVPKVSANDIVSSSAYTNLVNYVNSERSRRGDGAFSAATSTSSTVTANTLNTIKNSIAVDGIGDQPYWADGGGYDRNAAYEDPTPLVWGNAAAPGVSLDVAQFANITSSSFNQYVQNLWDAGTYCVCNCNYCTCNCNYCTCNCNYSCTCNCNYSDRRLKKNIRYLGVCHGIRVYIFEYINGGGKYAGVMAQDLIGTPYESALSIDARGFYMVDYSVLPVKMVEVK